MLSDILGSSAPVSIAAPVPVVESAVSAAPAPVVYTAPAPGQRSMSTANISHQVAAELLTKQVKQDWISDIARTNEDIGFLWCRLSVQPFFFFADVLLVFLTLSGCDVLVAGCIYSTSSAHGAREMSKPVCTLNVWQECRRPRPEMRLAGVPASEVAVLETCLAGGLPSEAGSVYCMSAGIRGLKVFQGEMAAFQQEAAIKEAASRKKSSKEHYPETLFVGRNLHPITTVLVGQLKFRCFIGRGVRGNANAFLLFSQGCSNCAWHILVLLASPCVLFRVREWVVGTREMSFWLISLKAFVCLPILIQDLRELAGQWECAQHSLEKSFLVGAVLRLLSVFPIWFQDLTALGGQWELCPTRLRHCVAVRSCLRVLGRPASVGTQSIHSGSLPAILRWGGQSGLRRLSSVIATQHVKWLVWLLNACILQRQRTR